MPNVADIWINLGRVRVHRIHLQYESLLTHLVPDREKQWDCKLDTWPDPSPFLVKIYTPFDILLIHPAARQEIVLNIALCGDWASNAWGSPGRGFRSGTEFEPGDPTKKKERKKWFERWFAERSFYVFVRGSEKLRSTWCLKKQGPALPSWASSEQRNLWVWGKRDKTLCKTVVSRFLFVLSLFAIHSPRCWLDLRVTGTSPHCRTYGVPKVVQLQGVQKHRRGKGLGGGSMGESLLTCKDLLPRVFLDLVWSILTILMWGFNSFQVRLLSFFLSFVFLCFSLFQLCSSLSSFFSCSFFPSFLPPLSPFFLPTSSALPLLGRWPIKCWIRARCIVQPADTLLTFAKKRVELHGTPNTGSNSSIYIPPVHI